MFKTLQTILFAALSLTVCVLLIQSCQRNALDADLAVSAARGGRWSHLDPIATRNESKGSWDNRVKGGVSNFFENGVRKSEGAMGPNGKEGLWRSWFESGSLRWQGTYRAGAVQGKALIWYEGGQLQSVGQYHDGELHGSFTKWYESGHLWYEGEYESSRRQGPFLYYRENGKLDLLRTGVYSDDKRIGALPDQQLEALAQRDSK